MSDVPVPLVDVGAENAPIRQGLSEAFERVLASGSFILGSEVEAFEEEVAEEVGARHAIGVSSGTDALLVALMALDIGPGDEVITSTFTFFATGGCISRLGARPVFVDIDPATFCMDPAQVKAAINESTRAIIPVHLFGRAADMSTLREVASAASLPLIEDAAQALGAGTERGRVGALGELACFSFFPSKNLGGFGDGGMVTTSSDELASRLRVLRAHGAQPKYFHSMIGGNFRLDALQAALLRVKLPLLEAGIAARRRNASNYRRWLGAAALPASRLRLPGADDPLHSWNQYVIRTESRDRLRQGLAERGIASAVYYPRPLHLQPCFAHLEQRRGTLPESERACDEVLALPIFATIGEERQRRVVDAVLEILGREP